MKKLLIFDLDGTLLDTLTDLKSAVNFALKEFGFPERTLDQIERSVGNGFRHLVTTSLPAASGERTKDEVLAQARAYYKEHFHDETRPYDGILPLLQGLQAEGYPLAIVSNKPDPMVKCLRDLFFADIFAYAVGEQPNVARKPAPDGIFAAMEHFLCTEAIYIGDSEVDILTAKNAKIPCISVTWGFRREAELQNAGAAFLCRRMQELYDCIHTL